MYSHVHTGTDTRTYSHIYMHAHTLTYAHICTHASTYSHMRTSAHIHRHTLTHYHICMHAHHAHTLTYTRTHTFPYTHTHTCTQVTYKWLDFEYFYVKFVFLSFEQKQYTVLKTTYLPTEIIHHFSQCYRAVSSTFNPQMIYHPDRLLHCRYGQIHRSKAIQTTPALRSTYCAIVCVRMCVPQWLTLTRRPTVGERVMAALWGSPLRGPLVGCVHAGSCSTPASFGRQGAISRLCTLPQSLKSTWGAPEKRNT